MRAIYIACLSASFYGVAIWAGGHLASTPAVVSAKSGPQASVENTEPGGTKADSDLAQSNPDEYAWRLFFFLARQAQTGTAGFPDPSKHTFLQYSPDAADVWETWALASGVNNQSEVFKCKAVEPAAWDKLPRPKDAFSKLVLSRNLTDSVAHVHGPFVPPVGQEDDL